MMQIDGRDVSRETIERLTTYATLLEKWSPKINLVSRASLAHLWDRHIVDSAQIYDLAPHPVNHWVDLGSGGGFPGLVIAILAQEFNSPTQLTLIESDARKCAFLRTVIRETGAPATVISKRIEDVEPLGAKVISARALANLPALLDLAVRHTGPDAMLLFPKGTTWRQELDQAQMTWRFETEIVKSKTETGPVILKLSGASRV